jgi:NAD(P)-dependent dehydrogenase (short-subunit alcohol dehydrogenase family)
VTFAAQLLAGRRVAMAGGGRPAVTARLAQLGAGVEPLDDDILEREEDAAAWARDRAPLSAAVIDAGDWFTAGGAGALTTMLELSWRAARGVATGALIEAAEPSRLLFIAPAAGAGRHAEPARAGLENLARTLSVEWARHAITVVALWPGEATTDDELAQLAGFLLSAAGGYFSGCRFELGGVVVRAR